MKEIVHQIKFNDIFDAELVALELFDCIYCYE